MSQPPTTYFPLRWESTGDQWWYASPIDYASANGHYDLVRELLRLDGNHLIKLASLRRIRRLETVWDDEHKERFHVDVAKNRSEVARKLLSECEIKKGKHSLIGSGYGGWLLYTAASAGDLSFVRELLERVPLLVFGEGEYGVTDIFYAAARSKSVEVFKVLLDFAISPRFSSCEDDQQCVGGEVPEAYRSEITNRAIHALARGGNLDLLKELIKDCLDDALAYRDNRGSTVLHAAAARGQVEIIQYLSSNSNITNSTDNNGNTALHVAAQRGHLSAVETLILASPALIHAKNNAGETLLHSVITGLRSPGFQRLDRQIELMKHILSNKLFKVEEIINFQDNEGRTPLNLAITRNIHSDLVELLMTVDYIDVNIKDVNGMTPLDILKKRPISASSEIIKRQLITAGGIFSSQDYSAIASHIRRQSIGNSPGTSFRINDGEIFLYTGLEYTSDERASGYYSPVRSRQGSTNMEHNHTPREALDNKTRSSVASAAQCLKRLIGWPKTTTRFRNWDVSKILAEITPAAASSEEVVPISLRERYSKPSSALPNNKRTLSVRSNELSPKAKKKIASGLIRGVMQAVPRRSSRSSSFSMISSMSSQSSVDITRQHVEQVSSSSSGLRPYDVYERSVLTAA